MKFYLKLLTIILLLSCETSETKRDRLFVLGNNALEMREFDQAIQYYDQALKFDNNFSLLFNNRGVAKIEDGRPHEAIQDYNQALLIDNNYVDCRLNRAHAYEEIGWYEKSLNDLIIARESIPDSAIVYFSMGLVYTRMKKYDSARSAFIKAKNLDANNIDTDNNLATLDYYEGNFTEALNKLDGIISKNKNAPNAFNTLNQVLISLEKFDEALKAINKALELVPGDPYFINNRGLTYLYLDSLSLALSDINQSIVIDPKNMWAYRNKGIFFLKNGDYPQAIRYLEKVVKEDPFVEDGSLYLGDAYLKNDEKVKACEIWMGIKELPNKANERLNKYCN